MPDQLCPVCLVDNIRTRLHKGACWKHGTQSVAAEPRPRPHATRAAQQAHIHDRVSKAVTVFEIWSLYRTEVLYAVTNPVQIEETRRGFYAGAAAILDLLLRVSPEEVSEDQGVEMLQALHDEIKAFATDIRGDHT